VGTRIPQIRPRSRERAVPSAAVGVMKIKAKTVTSTSSKSSRRIAAADPCTTAGLAAFAAFFLLLLVGGVLLPKFGDVELEDLGIIGRIATYMPLPLLISGIVLVIIGNRRTMKRIEARRSICIACGYNRTGLKPDEKCPECGITAET
jgi:hypothetical protein